MMARMLSDAAVIVADAVVNQLSELDNLQEGLSVLISILGATLNAQAPTDEDARMLATAAYEDLIVVMMAGRRGELSEGRVQ